VTSGSRNASRGGSSRGSLSTRPMMPALARSSPVAAFSASLQANKTRPACDPRISPENSEHILSADTFLTLTALAVTALRVLSSMENPNTAEKRMALMIRSASSRNRSSGTPTQRSNPSLRSSRPPYGSTKRPSLLQAMALTVKSRRARSASMSAVNSTESGLLPSEYIPSTLYVVTSPGSPPQITVTVPCLIPVSTVLRPSKQHFICSGLAEERTS